MELRRYKVFGERESGQLRDLVRSVADAWAEDWLPPSIGAGTEWAPAAGLAARFEGASWARYSAGDGEEWICAEEGDPVLQALGAALFGAATGSSAIAAELARLALQSLAGGFLGGDPELLKRRTGAAAAPPATFWLPGSAGTTVRLRLGPLDLRILASPAWTLRRLHERPAGAPGGAPLAALRDAVRGAACELRVLAGTARLDLRELRQLRPGDVIALGNRVDGALAVELAGRALLEARLGFIGGRRAVALAAPRQTGGGHGSG